MNVYDITDEALGRTYGLNYPEETKVAADNSRQENMLSKYMNALDSVEVNNDPDAHANKVVVLGGRMVNFENIRGSLVTVHVATITAILAQKNTFLIKLGDTHQQVSIPVAKEIQRVWAEYWSQREYASPTITMEMQDQLKVVAKAAVTAESLTRTMTQTATENIKSFAHSVDGTLQNVARSLASISSSFSEVLSEDNRVKAAQITEDLNRLAALSKTLSEVVVLPEVE